jgi:CotS family spore coat protein
MNLPLPDRQDMSRSFVLSLEKAFRCRIYGVKPRRNVHLLKTDRGHWIIKGYKEREKAEWVTRLSDTLQEKGFYQTVQYISDERGEKIFPFQNRYYTVMKMIDGREADNTSISDVKKSAATLARFHLAARGFPAPHPYAFEGKPAMLDKWESRLEHFERIIWHVEQNGPQNRLEQIILEMADEVIRDGREILQAAYKLPLASELFAVVEQGTLAHRDVASHNFLITSRGSCYLIDLDTVGHDMQLSDLVQLMGRMLLMQGYRVDSFVEAIEAYSSVNVLSDAQVWMIHQLLRYPDNFLREVTGVYANRPGYTMRGVLQLVQMEARLRRSRRTFLEAGHAIFQRSPWGSYHFVG